MRRSELVQPEDWPPHPVGIDAPWYDMLQLVKASEARPWSLAFSWGSQSWLQAGFSPPLCFEANFSRFTAPCPRHKKPEKIRANCVSGLFRADGGLKAACRHDCLPHRGGRLRAMNGQSRAASEARPSRPRAGCSQDWPAPRKRGSPRASFSRLGQAGVCPAETALIHAGRFVLIDHARLQQFERFHHPFHQIVRLGHCGAR